MPFDRREHEPDDRWESAARDIHGENVRGMHAFVHPPRRDDKGVVFEARWIDHGDRELSAGPDMVMLYIAPDASPEVQQRGLTTALLRHMERHLSAAMRELELAAVADSEMELRMEVGEFMASNPRSPRAGGEIYYAALLRLWSGIEERARTGGWLPRALELTADEMNLKVETLRTRIRTARKLAADSNEHKGEQPA